MKRAALGQLVLLAAVVLTAACADSVEVVPVSNVSVGPDPARVDVGDTTDLDVVLEDDRGNALGGRHVEWATADSGIARVAGEARVMGRSPGTTTIRADVGGVSGTAGVTVESPVSGVSDVAAGAHHTCAILEGGRTFCWGALEAFTDGSGNLSATRGQPMQVDSGVVFVSVAAGGSEESPGHTCGLTEDGTAYCWGHNSEKQTGTAVRGTSVPAPRPVETAVRFRALDAGGVGTCGLDDAGDIHCWGYIAEQLDSVVRVPASHRFIAITVGARHACALAADGTAHCWGSNHDGRLGTGTESPVETTLQPVTGGLRFVDIAAGEAHTCALTEEAETYCWGAGGDGLLGDGTLTSTASSPRRVDTGAEFTDVDAQGHQSCGITTDGAMFCWGRNDAFSPAVSDLNRLSTPIRVDDGIAFNAITTGGSHRCAVRLGVVFCWGDNAEEQLGPRVQSKALPTAVLAFP